MDVNNNNSNGYQLGSCNPLHRNSPKTTPGNVEALPNSIGRCTSPTLLSKIRIDAYEGGFYDPIMNYTVANLSDSNVYGSLNRCMIGKSETQNSDLSTYPTIIGDDSSSIPPFMMPAEFNSSTQLSDEILNEAISFDYHDSFDSAIRALVPICGEDVPRSTSPSYPVDEDQQSSNNRIFGDGHNLDPIQSGDEGQDYEKSCLIPWNFNSRLIKDLANPSNQRDFVRSEKNTVNKRKTYDGRDLEFNVVKKISDVETVKIIAIPNVKIISVGDFNDEANAEEQFVKNCERGILQVNFEDGGKFVGTVRKGQPSGFGVLTLNGRTIVGDFEIDGENLVRLVSKPQSSS